MFIMSNINIMQDLVSVYDTKDNTNDTVRLSILANQILSKKIKVYGVGSLAGMKRSDAIPVMQLGIYISYNEAKEALATYYQQLGMSRQEARKKVGLA